MTIDSQRIRTTLDIAKTEIETLCRLAPAAKLTSISVERHSLAAHHALNSYLNQVMAFFDSKEKKHKTSFRAMFLNEDKDTFLQRIKSDRFSRQQQIILDVAYKKSNALGNKSLTYLREAGNEERHKSLMRKVILSDKGWRIGKGKQHVFACWKNSTCEAIESDFNFLPEQERRHTPILPQRDGERRTRNGVLVVFKGTNARNNLFKEATWLPGCLMSTRGTIHLYGSSINSFRGGSIFLSRESRIAMENCKIIIEDGTFHGDIFVEHGRLKTIPYCPTSSQFVEKEIRDFTDRNVFVSFGKERANLIGYLLSAYCICEDVFATFKTLVEAHTC